MYSSWRIPEEIETLFRRGFDHAAKRRVAELYDMLEQLSDEQWVMTAGLCGLVTAYTAIDVVERRWPNDAQLHQMAQGTTEEEKRDEQFGVTEENLYLWLSQCALGFKPYTEVFEGRFDDAHQFLAAPFCFTVNLISRFCPERMSIGEFLDMMEDAYERASLVDLNLIPALMVRSRAPQPEQAPDASVQSR